MPANTFGATVPQQVTKFRRQFADRLGGADVVQIQLAIPEEFGRDLEPGSTVTVAEITASGPQMYDRVVGALREVATQLGSQLVMR